MKAKNDKHDADVLTYGDMVEERKQKGNTRMPIHKILSSLREYQAIQRGGYWEHDPKNDARRIKEWHRAIDAAIYVVEAVAKTETLFKTLQSVVERGDYPMVVPSDKSVNMDVERLFGHGKRKSGKKGKSRN